MNDHAHILVARSGYRIEYLVIQLKGAATRALGLQRTPWARRGWKVFINTEEALYAAAEYIRANPVVAGMAQQNWPFVTRLPARPV